MPGLGLSNQDLREVRKNNIIIYITYIIYYIKSLLFLFRKDNVFNLQFAMVVVVCLTAEGP